jgi:hypothetical protein
MQSAINTTIEEKVFPMWFAYIHCWARKCFLLFRIKSSPVVNRKSVVEREWSESSAVKEKGSAED